MSDDKTPQDEYAPPQVEKISTEDGPAVTAAGKSNQTDETSS